MPKYRAGLSLVIAVACQAVAHAGICSDPGGACPDPCPAENSCTGPYGSSDGCPDGLICVPACLPSWCYCDTRHEPSWACSFDCAGECYEWPEPAGPPTHTVTDIGTLAGGIEAHANAINNYGHIVGDSGAPDGAWHATLWAEGQIVDLGPWNVWSSAVDINNHRQVLVNHSGDAFMWEDGVLIPLGALTPGGSAEGKAINDVGQIIGRSPAYTGASFLWQECVMINFGEMAGMGAEAINNLGHMAGAVRAETETHASIWNGTDVVDIGTLGGEYAYATGINDLDQVVGESERAPGGDRRFFGFFWDGERMYDVTELGGPDAIFLQLNNCGEVLIPGDRRSDEAFYIYHADRGLRPVRGVFGPATGWWDFTAWDMNDRGEIVGRGSTTGPGRAILIAPIEGDLEGDGDVDLQDWHEFSCRFTGPRTPAIPGCERADMDRDADVDLADFAQFQQALTD